MDEFFLFPHFWVDKKFNKLQIISLTWQGGQATLTYDVKDVLTKLYIIFGTY